MMEFSVVNENGTALDTASPAVIKVIGCGGGGSNAVNRMIDAKIANVEFIVLNTDLQDLNRSKAETRMQIGKKIAKGLGAGGDPKVGEEAAEEDKEAIGNLVKNCDMIFIAAGMGGGTGTGSAPVVARIARELGVLTVGVVTTPFEFEGPVRMRQAKDGIKKLHEHVDSLIIIPNEQLLKVVDKTMPLREAFLVADDVLRQGVEGISNIITKPGEVNRDFTDVKNAMAGKGDAILGVGIGEGENRALDAATKAIKNPMLEDTNIDGAKNVLVNICSSGNITALEVSEIIKELTASADPNATVLWGQVVDETLGDKISVTLIATGFGGSKIEEPKETIEETETSYNSSLVSNDEFSNILGSGNIDTYRKKLATAEEKNLFDEPVLEKVPVGVASSATFEKTRASESRSEFSSIAKVGSLGKAISDVVPRYSASPLKPPADFKNTNDLSQPACWRNGLGNFSRGIKLHD